MSFGPPNFEGSFWENLKSHDLLCFSDLLDVTTTPKLPQEIQEIILNCSRTYNFRNVEISENRNVGYIGQEGEREVLEARIINLENLGCGINIYQKTLNGIYESLE